MESKAFSLNTKDIANLGKNALLVGIGAAVAYIGQNVSHIDLGAASAFIVPVITIALDAVIKWTKDNTKA